MILVVVDNLHFVLQAIFPSENDPPLLVDPNAPKSCQLPLQLLKSVAWRNLKIFNDSRLVEHPQLASGPLLDFSRQASYSQTTIDAFSRRIAETFDHQKQNTPTKNFVKRNYASRNFLRNASSPLISFDRFGKICLQLFEGFALGKTTRKSRDFSPESALFRLMNNCLQFHGDTLPALLAVHNLKFATTSE
jgi:hypothetical protein